MRVILVSIRTEERQDLVKLTELNIALYRFEPQILAGSLQIARAC